MEVRRIPRIILDGDEESASHMAREGIRQLGILKELMSFNDLQQDIRKVEYIDGSRIVCRSCFGEDVVYLYAVKEEKGKLLPKLYVYVTISNYVTIWDLLTGEVATDICNNDGKVYDYYGESLITFPCHKSELVRWLEGIKDKPTRQVLKDEPGDNRDYLNDNEIDIGNENRVELANTNDPSYKYYFGVKDPCVFTNIVQNIHTDTDPTYPYTYPRKVYNLLEKDTPQLGYVVNCKPEDCNKSFSAGMNETYFYNSNCFDGKNNSVSYFEPYQPRSKKLYLCSYPGLAYTRPGFPPKSVEYSTPYCSPYLDPIIMKSSAASFSCWNGFESWDWSLNCTKQGGNTASFSTVLGDLIVNYNSARDLPDESMSLYDTLRQGFDSEGDCFSLFLREGVCHYLCKGEQRGENWYKCEDIRKPIYATDTFNWCLREALSKLDQRESESNRFGVSWCGSPYDYHNPLDGQTSGWYRVLLRFYMGGFHTSGRSVLHIAGDDPCLDCPTESVCNDYPSRCSNFSSWSNKLKERFSYVQPTVELEKPDEYPKDTDVTKYERPEDYDEDPDGTGYCVDKKYSTLCAFPDRDCGYPEDAENSLCFPFDGTYILHTLGEAVEELINNHYEDGSDDQLLVYLYERPNMIQQSTG